MDEIRFMRKGEKIMSAMMTDESNIDPEIIDEMVKTDDDGNEVETTFEEHKLAFLILQGAAVINTIHPLMIGDEIWIKDALHSVIGHDFLTQIMAFEMETKALEDGDGLIEARVSIHSASKIDEVNAYMQDFVMRFNAAKTDNEQEAMIAGIPRILRQFFFDNVRPEEDNEDLPFGRLAEYKEWEAKMMALPEPAGFEEEALPAP